MERKPKNDVYVKPMPRGLFLRLMKEFKRMGGKVIMDKEAERYLDDKGAEACTLNAETILFRRKPSRAAVYEELFHVKQFREGKIDGTLKNSYVCEIEAKKYLLNNASILGLTEIEIIATQKSLEFYMKKLQKLEEYKYDDM